MGKSMPSPPPPPDPYAVAKAQGEANIDTSIANSWMGNANETTPYGSVNYSEGPSKTVAGREVPTFNRSVTLSGEQQYLLDQQNYLASQMNDAAGRQLSRVDGILGSPIDPSALQPARADTPDGPQFYSAPGSPQLNRVTLDHGTFGSVGGPQRSVGLGRVSGDLGNAGNIQTSLNQRGAQSGIGDVGDFARNVNMQQAGTQFANVGSQQRSLGSTDFSGDRQRVEDALYSRLNPQLDRDRAALETQLVNQGFQRDSDAYRTEMDAFGRQANDARMQTVLAGGQEQTRLANIAAQAGQFANQAQNTDYEQAFGRGQFANQATGQNNQAALAAAQYGQGAQQQAFGQGMDRASLYNQATAQDNASTALQGQFANQAQNQQFGQNQARGMFGLDAMNANNAATMGEGQFANDAQNQAMAQYIGQLGFQNDTATSQAGFNNDVNQQNFGNEMQGTQFDNSIASQRFDADMARAGYQNASRQQGMQEQLALRNQPINEITALMSGGQVSMPQFAPYQYQPSAPPPVADSVYNSARIEQQNYKSQMASQNAQMGGMFGLIGNGLMGAMRFSDRRLKRDVQDIGVRLKNGLRLYAYRYAGEAVRRVGVMADEVERVLPRAVSNVGGFKAVDYARIMGAA